MTNTQRTKFLAFALISVALILSILSLGFASAVQATVNLGEAGHFAMLSEAQVTDAGPATSLITGDVGVHPAAGTLIEDISCSTVTGTIYDNNAGYTGGFDTDVTCLVTDPVLLGNAIFDMDAARVDAQGRTHLPIDVAVDTNEIDGGILSPTTPSFKPGLHTWSTAVTITTSITLDCSADPNGIFIFQVGQTLDLASGAQIFKTNCQASNIFWAVSGATTLGTTSVFEGTILGVTGISTLADSTVHGRLLAQTAVTLDGTGNIVTIPGTMPATPIVTNDDTANTVSGIDATMEYKLDAAVNYTTYDSVNFSLLDFSGDHTLLVRVAASGFNPASSDTTLIFTTNPAPASSSGGGGGGGGDSDGGSYQFGGRIATTTTPLATPTTQSATTPTTSDTSESSGSPITGAAIGSSGFLGLSAFVWLIIGIGVVGIGILIKMVLTAA